MKRIVVALVLLLTVAWLHEARSVGSTARIVPDTTAKPLSAAEASKLEAYLRNILGNSSIRLVHMPPDAEIYVGDQFLGFVYPDEDKEGRTFYFEIPIFETEIEESPPPRRIR
jgi:hypothetical protein